MSILRQPASLHRQSLDDAVPCRAMPCRAVPCHAMPFLNLLPRTLESTLELTMESFLNLILALTFELTVELILECISRGLIGICSITWCSSS